MSKKPAASKSKGGASSSSSGSEWWAVTAPVPQCALSLLLEADAEDEAAQAALERIHAIRRVHDKACTRWPPHINLAWPFVPVGYAERVLARLESSAALHEAARVFSVRLERIERNEGSRFIHLSAHAPQLDALARVVRQLFPTCTRDGDAAPAHVSLGQIDQKTADDTLAALQSTWVPVDFRIRAISILARNSDSEPMKVRATFALKEEEGDEA